MQETVIAFKRQSRSRDDGQKHISTNLNIFKFLKKLTIELTFDE